MSRVYKILTQDDWGAMRAAGAFEGSAADKADGYIHMSTTDQLVDTLNKHYKGQRDLQILSIETEALDETKLVWEPAREGALFPHLYGPLPLEAVTSSYVLSPLDSGAFVLP